MMKRKKDQSGFSYIDVMAALVILFIGLLASTAALTANLLRSYESEKQALAKQMGLSTIESIFAARDIARDGAVESWETIGNVGTNPRRWCRRPGCLQSAPSSTEPVRSGPCP